MILCNWSHFGLGYIIWGVYSMGCFGPPLGRFLVALAPLWSYELDGAQKTKMLKPEWFFNFFEGVKGVRRFRKRSAEGAIAILKEEVG